MQSLRNLNKSTRYKYKRGQMVYTPDTKSFGIICYRGTRRAYGIKEYYVKWIESPRMDNYYLERELDYWVKEYDRIVGNV